MAEVSFPKFRTNGRCLIIKVSEKLKQENNLMKASLCRLGEIIWC